MLKHLTADFVLIDLSFLEEIPAGNYIYICTTWYNMGEGRGGGGGRWFGDARALDLLSLVSC